MAENVSKDIFASPLNYDYLVHQCNCLTIKSHGFSELVGLAFGQEADVYATRQPVPGQNLSMVETRGFPGTVTILPTNQTQVHVVALFGQWAPGSLTSPWPAKYVLFKREAETATQRERWFKMALMDLEMQLPDGCRVAFPWQIGCGLAGGDWDTYASMIHVFAERIKARGIVVQIYKKD